MSGKKFNYIKETTVAGIPVRIDLDVNNDKEVFDWFCKRIDDLFNEYYKE